MSEAMICPDPQHRGADACCGYPDNCAGPGFAFATSEDLARALGDPEPERVGRQIGAIVRRGSIRVLQGGLN